MKRSEFTAVWFVAIVALGSYFAGYYGKDSYLLACVPAFFTLLMVLGVYLDDK